MFIDRFVTSTLKKRNSGREDLRKQRLVAYAIFITALFAIFYVLVSIITKFQMGILIMSCCFFWHSLALFLLLFGLNVNKVAHFFGLTATLSIFGCVYYSGGVYSPVFPWLVETPVVLLLIAGKKAGYFWVAISLLLAGLIGVLKLGGHIFPTAYDHSRETFFFLTCNIGLMLIIFSISIIFDNFRVAAYGEVTHQKNELQSTLSELKNTQEQLIQAEKMASLGELTAGIAHEIQNPLNFVNNFSEVSQELLDEMKEEIANGEYDEANKIVNDVIQNLEKITHHGKRADGIVKGMLQHSRKRTAEKEPTDINKLVDEYLRLAYHGLRAKDKSFNVTLETDFDDSVALVNVIPQDMGRVVLNLITNAFYAVNEKKSAFAKAGKENNYEPTVWITTRNNQPQEGRRDGAIQIYVRDNGIGIPTNVLNKIFQPFFTTKPTGQGTGLGLSMSYDIIKAHGGELNVETEEGKGTNFTITLPK